MEQIYFHKIMYLIFFFIWLVLGKGLCVVNKMMTKQTRMRQFDIRLNNNSTILICILRFVASRAYIFFDDPTVMRKRNLWSVLTMINYIPITANRKYPIKKISNER